MTLNPIANSVLVAWYLGLSLILTVAVIALAVGLQRLNARLEQLTAQLDPVLQKADQALSLANEKLSTIGEATENLLAHGEAVAVTVEAKTATTSSLIQRTVHAPFVGANALLAGLAIGARTFGVLQSRRKRPSKETTTHDQQ